MLTAPFVAARNALAEGGAVPSYKPVRALAPPVIDGLLDEPIWKEAPRDSRFFSKRTKPYGQPTKQPTTVQVAYDEEYLYVAFRCGYETPGVRDDALPPDESTLFDSEVVWVFVDPHHDHANARGFAVGRTGARADVEWSNNGNTANLDWRAIWQSATRYDKDWWTAEYAIPWGTVGLPAHVASFDIGINFLRREPTSVEAASWALEPPGHTSPSPSLLGHLEGMSLVAPTQRLFLQPYLAGGLRQDASAPLSRLRDFTGHAGNASTYGGFYARYRPAGPLQIDATMNPDFSAATPDAAVSNLDRFELQFPEARPFFAEDRARFEFGSSNAQLFYTRRVGLKTLDSGAYQEVPIVYGTKAIVRASGTEVAAMNVGLSTSDPRVSLADSVSVVRLNHSFGSGRRLGNIFLNRFGGVSNYNATGVDGAYTFFDEHVVVSGFLARSATAGATPSGMGQVDLQLTSEDFSAGVQYLDVGTAFDAQLGYFQTTGIRAGTVYGFYTPVLNNDLIRQVYIGGKLKRARNRDESTLYDRGSLSAEADLTNGGYIGVLVNPAKEVVPAEFKIAGDRLTIPVGRYDVVTAQLFASTPARRTVEGQISYSEGDLFGGYKRVPSVKVGLNLGRYTGTALYELSLLHFGAQDLTTHRLSLRSTYSYTPLARSTLVIEASTFNLRSIVQLVNSYTFGTLSTVAFVVSGTTGVTLDTTTDRSWYGNPNLTAVLSFAYGMTPF